MLRILAVMIVLAGAAGGLALGMAFRPGELDPARADEAADRNAAGGEQHRSGEDAAGLAASGQRESGSPPGASAGGGTAIGDHAYVKLGRQIVIPIVSERRTEALMLFEVALDVPSGMTERAYGAEPRLRDAFIRTLLAMSYTGAFSQTYTDERVTRELRDKLRADAARILDGPVFDVLILDMLRQEL